MESIFKRSEIARRETSRRAVLRIWRFGNATLDERTLELTVDGKPVALERKQLELLAFFLQNAGEVIFKDRIAQAVWPGRAVSDSNLTKCIAILRQALGDEDQIIIKTVHGYGYWLTTPVQVESATPAHLLPDNVSEIAVALR
jgi:eukaryotic-like serine/threonine-protein kinase